MVGNKSIPSLFVSALFASSTEENFLLIGSFLEISLALSMPSSSIIAGDAERWPTPLPLNDFGLKASKPTVGPPIVRSLSFRPIFELKY
jgi:hypothetical protein